MPTLSRPFLGLRLVTIVGSLLLITTAEAAKKPTASDSTILRVPPAQMLSIDRSIIRSRISRAIGINQIQGQVKSLAGEFGQKSKRLELLKLSETLTGLLAKVTSYVSAPENSRLGNTLYIGASIQAGEGAPITSIPDVVYEDSQDRITLSYDNITGRFNSQHVGIRYALAQGLLPRLLSGTNHLLQNTVSPNRQFSEDIGRLTLLNISLRKALNYQQRDGSDKAVISPITIARLIGAQILALPAPRTDTTEVLDDYLQVARQPAVSLSADYQSIEGGGYLSSFGLSASKLFPLHGGRVPPAVTTLLSADNIRVAQDGAPGALGTRLGAALIWQDRAPALTPDRANLAAPWNIKAGLEYATPLLGTHETYAEFIRYRDPRSYAEVTVTAGKDGARADYLGIDIGRTFHF